MIAVETNVLVYAHRREVAEHHAAAEVVRGLAEGAEPWGIPWPCLYEFVSVVTNRRIWRSVASTPAQAWAQVRGWCASPGCALLGETEDFLPLLESFALRPRVLGPVIHDARIAAICTAHGVHELLTRDRDFSSFPELRVRNPFAPS